MHVLERINHQRNELSRAEHRVATWLQDHPARAVGASLAEVAVAAEVSEPTVIRLCRTLGYSGFRELKAHLAGALQQPEGHLHHDVTSGDSPESAAGKVIESSIRGLVDLRAIIPQLPLDEAVTAMAAARQLVFVGIGASGLVASDAAHKFFRLGIPCSTALDAQTILQRAAMATDGDLLVAISHTGFWPEVVHAMTLARQRGACIIAVTDPASALAATADLLIGCRAREDTSVFTPMSSRLVHLALLDALQVALALRLGAAAEENLRLTKEALAADRKRSEPVSQSRSDD